MKTPRILIAITAAALFAACSSGTPSATNAAEEPAAPEMEAKDNPMEATEQNAAAPVETAQGLTVGFEKNQPYADFRNLALGLGWVPLKDSQCKVNVVGANHAELCAGTNPLANCKVCDELPELSSCSGDGNCLVRFSHPDSAEILEATGYGDVADWRTTGNDASLRVSSWELTQKPKE